MSRGNLWNVLAVMGLAGLGVGALFAMVPVLIVECVPADETASAVGFNLVARTLGVAAGSAVCGVVLQSATPTHAAVAAASGYTTAALIATGVLLTTAVAEAAALLHARVPFAAPDPAGTGRAP